MADAAKGAASAVRMVNARGGAVMPALGLGTWRMGLDPAQRRAELAALKLGLDLGLTLLDTAESYADGGAEELVGRAIKGRRDDVYIVTKVKSINASRAGTLEAAERSLKRLATDRIDLYLLHTVSKHPLEDTLESLERLVEQGKIRHYGVSNFDFAQMTAMEQLPLGRKVVSNQLMYSLLWRSLEHKLLGWCAENGVSIMAFSPLDEGRLLPPKPALRAVAKRHGVTPATIAIAWTIRHPLIVSIPKAARQRHVREVA
ncbi:MAG: aldo/keto reductase, partial [Alphaproteobacteria bacterium]